MDLVTVILVNHNYGEYIVDAIGSVLSQTYSRLEMIVVDDCSSDSSRERIEKSSKIFPERFERLISLFLPENRGPNYAINEAIPLVKGKIALILDADDLLHPEYVSRTVDALIESRKTNSQIGFVYTDCYLVDSNGTPTARGKSTHFDANLIQSQSYIPGCATTLTRTLKEGAPFHVEVRAGSKHSRWKKLIESGWAGLYLECPLFFYRMHDRNLSGIGRKVLGAFTESQPVMHLLSGYWSCAGTESLP